MHIHNYNKCITITDIINFIQSYHGLIQVFMLTTGLCSFRTLVGVTELNFMQNLYLYYGVYTCSEVPIGTIERLQNVCWYCGTYSYTKVLVSTTEINQIQKYP